MKKLYINEILYAVNGELLSGFDRTLIDSVSINSREIKNGALFVPIKGENVDGHKFIEEAFAAGAVATLTSEHNSTESDKIYIKVKDTKIALQQLAAYYRRKFKIPVVGITGSVGKTSTKEMIFSVLSAKFNVHKTAGNLNGKIGLPLTIFGIEPCHDVAVVEMGISEFDEMATLSETAAPTCAVMTNIGVTHIENLHTKENIFKEKFKITNSLNKSDYLFINGDDEVLSKTQNSYRFNVVSFGIKNSCNFTARNVFYENEATTFEVLCDGNCLNFKIPTIGEHHVYNALAAIAIGLSMGMDVREIQVGLSRFKNVEMRQSIHYLDGVTLIDDSYNANPDSMKSALKVLAQVAKSGRKIAVLADMLELGEMARQLHFEVGIFAAQLGVDILITVGELAKFISDGAISFNKNIVSYSFSSNEEALDRLKVVTRIGDSILVKGSRGMHMEEISQKVVSLYKK
ncbi:MAG: UDP-N-acetylmuramoyl-tripeptide--D-alanyl-D-alanine ligase [Acutalibacteraceae bacterium]